MADMDELRILVALGETGSVSQAANSLQTSRARVRRKLAALEERAGVELLARVDGVLRPTDPGASLIEGANRLLGEAALLIARIRDSGKAEGLARIPAAPENDEPR